MNETLSKVSFFSRTIAKFLGVGVAKYRCWLCNLYLDNPPSCLSM